MVTAQIPQLLDWFDTLIDTRNVARYNQGVTEVIC